MGFNSVSKGLNTQRGWHTSEPFLHPALYSVFYLLFQIPRSVSIEIRLGKWNEAIHSTLPLSSKTDCLLASDKEMSVGVEREQGERKVGFQNREGVSPL